MTYKTISFTPALEKYYRAVAFREAPILAELRAETAIKTPNPQMQIGPEQGAFMAMLARLISATHIIEFGTFTGYSSLAMALGSQAQITAVDVSEEWTAIAKRYWQKAGVASRITLRLDGGTAVIADLLSKGAAGTFDMAFIDADKTGYDAYYEGCLKLLRPGGLILIDNVLWRGSVANPAKQDEDTVALRELNAKIQRDARVEMVMLAIADGLTLARKI
jgi:predicted O-methyltransferase YrrM